MKLRVCVFENICSYCLHCSHCTHTVRLKTPVCGTTRGVVSQRFLRRFAQGSQTRVNLPVEALGQCGWLGHCGWTLLAAASRWTDSLPPSEVDARRCGGRMRSDQEVENRKDWLYSTAVALPEMAARPQSKARKRCTNPRRTTDSYARSAM